MGDLGGFIENTTGINMGNHSAADHAQAAQQDATNQANETQRYIYDTQRADQQPWKQAGVQALSGLSDPNFQRDFSMGDFQKDPGYQFRMDEGQKAIERSAAARGGLQSGATLKELSRYGQDYASNEYGNAYNRFNNNATQRFNRLSSIAGLGQTAQGEIANAANNYGNQVSANQIGMGNANAAASIAQGNNQARFVQGLQQNAATGMRMATSDQRVKTNIEKVSSEDLAELRSVITPYKFNYANDTYGTGDWVGVMAQDLEKSKLGRTLVTEDSEGIKHIDLNKFASLLLATMAEG